MSKGKAKVNYLGRSGVVMPQTVPSWEFIYETSLVKSPKYDVGDRVVLPDGREFVYAKSSGVCSSAIAVQFVYTGVQAIQPAYADAAVGDTEVIITGTTHDAIDKDALRGGYFASWPAANKDQFRGIIGNDASGSAANIKVYLDGPLTVKLTAATTQCELYENPYGSLAGIAAGGSSVLAKAGVPAVYVSAANMYFWVQRHGMTWVAPQSDMITNKIGGYFRHDGSVQADQAFSGLVAGSDTTQYAGHRVIGNYAGNGPLFYLQG